ncbi:MAG: DMT family transporter [Deltaproteobacteria bacterium]|nr:DMT family transporter [Deltaproteobacteria bacterium]
MILLAGQVCFAALPVAGRLALADIPAGVIPLVRTIGGALMFTLIAWRRDTLRIEKRDVPFLLLCALLGNVLNQELFIHGLARTSATNAVVIGATIPVFTALAVLVLGKEPARPRRLIGIAIAFGGVAALVGAEELSMSSAHLTGSLMVLANALSYGIYLAIVRPLADKYDPITLLAFMFLAGIPMVAPIGIHALATDTHTFTSTDYGFLAFLIAVPTVGAYTFVQIGLKRAEASLVAAYIYLQPLFATVGAVLLLDEHVGPRTLVCGVVVLGGVWLAAKSRP